jgi:hypothetical protein
MQPPGAGSGLQARRIYDFVPDAMIKRVFITSIWTLCVLKGWATDSWSAIVELCHQEKREPE